MVSLYNALNSVIRKAMLKYQEKQSQQQKMHSLPSMVFCGQYFHNNQVWVGECVGRHVIRGIDGYVIYQVACVCEI